jgi:YVTN family beta-propeller protein
MRTSLLLLAFGATLLAGGERIYVDNSGGADISVIDPATKAVTGVIKVSKHSHGIAASPDKSRLYVSSEVHPEVACANSTPTQVVVH